MAGVDLTATIVLLDFDGLDSISERVIVLSEPNWSVKIGRGTLSGDEALRPAHDNAWFDSRVMSRNHAIIRADPQSRHLTIEDTDSMHGTQCNGRRLKPKVAQLLVQRDTLVFGADVTRGSSQFRALKVVVTTSWSDLEHPNPTLPLQLPSFRNTFSADYSEEDMYDDAADQDHIDDEASIVAAAFHDEANVASTDQPSLATSYGYPRNWSDYAEDDRPNAQDDDDDDEVEIVDQPIRAPSVEVVIPPRAESVLVSDDSDRASSYFSEDKVDESPTSSPVAVNDDHNNSDHDSSSKAFNSREDNGQEDPAGAFPNPYPTHFAVPAEAVVMKSHSDSFIPVSSLGSVYEAGSSSTLKPIALLHSSDTARAPSPSEVAMVKPTPEVIVQQPFFHELPAYRGVPSYPLDMPGRDPVWDSPSWDFYDTPHSRLAVVSGNAGVGDLNQFSVDTPYTRPISQDSHHLAIPTSSARYSNTPPPPAQATEAVPTPKCSIAQLLDEHKNIDEQGRNLERSLKRKADKTSDSTEAQSFGTHDLATQTKKLHSEPLLEENSDIASLPTRLEANITSTGQSVPEVALDPIDTRPRKKVKTEPSQGGRNDGGSIMKMAAATIVGVAIGTVGTIIGLVALPQDYFL